MFKLYTMNINELREPEFYSVALSKLSEERLNKMNKYKCEDDKLRSLAASYLLDSGLSFYNLSLKNATIELGKNNKPFIKSHPEIHFNLSHSGEYAVCVISDDEVGVDIEKIKPIKPALFKYALSEKEQAEVLELPEEKRAEAFVKLWTEKEAFLKYLGIGITVKLSEIAVEFAEELAGCKVEHIGSIEGYALTVCHKCEK